ncbi:MAG: hypothetical protein M1826_001313 [Phylliscum demangeonii]|nr:MAG: hypothetical protein M1826_001313 [Phylliscum demangeonii]
MAGPSPAPAWMPASAAPDPSSFAAHRAAAASSLPTFHLPLPPPPTLPAVRRSTVVPGLPFAASLPTPPPSTSTLSGDSASSAFSSTATFSSFSSFASTPGSSTVGSRPSAIPAAAAGTWPAAVPGPPFARPTRALGPASCAAAVPAPPPPISPTASVPGGGVTALGPTMSLSMSTRMSPRAPPPPELWFAPPPPRPLPTLPYLYRAQPASAPAHQTTFSTAGLPPAGIVAPAAELSAPSATMPYSPALFRPAPDPAARPIRYSMTAPSALALHSPSHPHPHPSPAPPHAATPSLPSSAFLGRLPNLLMRGAHQASRHRQSYPYAGATATATATALLQPLSPPPFLPHHYPPPLPSPLHAAPHSGPLPHAASSERPYRCDLCPQSFNRNHDLKRHKRIHLAVKPFPCSHCDKSFSRKDALKRHLLVKGCGKPRLAEEEVVLPAEPDLAALMDVSSSVAAASASAALASAPLPFGLRDPFRIHQPL